MSDPRDDIHLKIEWAYKHIDEFHSVIKAFMNTKPYGFAIDRDPKTGEVIYFVSKAEETPFELSLIAGDILQNLRTALDYLACCLVRANGGKPTIHTMFPISDSAPTTPEQKTSFQRKVKGMRQEAIDEIHAIKPYKGGNNVLWRLNRLNNIDKHRLLFSCGAAFRAWNAGQHLRATNPLPAAQAMADHWIGPVGFKPSFPLKVGHELYRDVPGAEVNKNIQITIDIAFNEPGVSEGEPLMLVLRSTLNRVRGIVDDFSGML